MRFKGRFNQNLDSKGRLSVPAPFREQLAAMGADTLVMTCTDKCLEIFSAVEWEKLLAKFDQLPQMDEDVELLQLFYISQAVDVSPDKNGRMLVPRPLRDQVGLKKEIVIVGSKDKFQVYSHSTWEDVEKKARKRFSEIRTKYSGQLT